MQLRPVFSTSRLSRWAKAAAPVVLAAIAAFTAVPAPAQSPFSPAIRVNQDIVTWYELDQRMQFLQLLRIPGSTDEEVRQSLIDDSLRMQALRDAGFEIAPEDVQQGIDDFAARGRFSTDEFLQILGDAGIAPETVRDFIRVQIGWRDYISARFISRARPTDEEIDRAMGQAGGSGLQVLLSEIIIPVTPQTLEQAEALAEELSLIEGFDAFSEAAEQYSAADTRTNGGRLDWLPLNNLPPALQPVILSLNKGEVSAPLTLPNAIAIFQMRGVREVAAGAPRYSQIDYAAYYMAGGRSPETLKSAAELAARVDTCDDLYGVAKGQPPQVLDRVSAKPGEIPRDIALELSKLDPGEISTALTRNNGQTLMFLMLCGRTRDLGEDTSRQDVANALTNQRLQAFAESLLEQLRADAVIIEQ
ncbi:peptidylprolyl isomerase [Ruegeria marisrubri]|uniref:Parvulin-like PPIase n=1 Tax=Ruegeria marisrubri TaxID=1685379 RepID=A0A0X3U0K8_9RHOB|nr:peptidylprolyl isomerase [Ruegeria marisrubri]KUJ80861.1 peptidylprolyl isomerase [Ruegeria marisrubri]